jgi:hypothetical protein
MDGNGSTPEVRWNPPALLHHRVVNTSGRFTEDGLPVIEAVGVRTPQSRAQTATSADQRR